MEIRVLVVQEAVLAVEQRHALLPDLAVRLPEAWFGSACVGLEVDRLGEQVATG
jgi:hypothetical protein